ncbi:hypothetical protein FGO68_gene3350 [Halteria grandinella]|uniref:Uncharacterized protein n=1 Tax=Halteria grandinella TaxID=5974 RepID=A0A8J8P4W8_HALGN|nr:hypothetical protein FGO68_gene3350 [Halteria grandinella]
MRRQDYGSSTQTLQRLNTQKRQESKFLRIRQVSFLIIDSIVFKATEIPWHLSRACPFHLHRGIFLLRSVKRCAPY